jgi:hypothetical protein
MPALENTIADGAPAALAHRWDAGTVVLPALGPPQAFRGEAGALDQRRELGPHDARVLALVQRPLRKPTVGPGDDPLPARSLS